jgi:hypothetical protein
MARNRKASNRQSPAPPDGHRPAHDQIAALAYQYWQARGCEHGAPEDDWLRAETELKKKLSEEPRAE